MYLQIPYLDWIQHKGFIKELEELFRQQTFHVVDIARIETKGRDGETLHDLPAKGVENNQQISESIQISTLMNNR